jgi:hypothetical protein
MNSRLLKAFITISLFCAAIPASANLIINGGFEDAPVKDGKWAWYYSSDVNGWEGSNIEIWNNFRIFSAVEGTNLAELNAHPSNGSAFSIFQTFDTTVGSIYDLSFFYGARVSNNESFRLNLYAADNTEMLSEIIDDHEVKKWSFYSNSFKATSDSTTLMFTSVFPESATVGNFLDDISVIASSTNNRDLATDVPEPSTIFLAGFGLLMIMRKKIKGLIVQSK